jgi:hypothetical protein
MKRTILSISACALIILALSASLKTVASGGVTINFDDLPDFTAVTEQYANLGVHFSSATILRKGGSLSGAFPPRSGLGVIFDFPTGVITATFDAPHHIVGGYITGNRNITLRAFNQAGQVLGSASTGGPNYVGSGGPPPNMLLQVISSGTDIVRVTFSDSGNTYTVDDFFFDSTPFDTCMRDDATGNLLMFNSSTGDYQFMRCSDSFTMSGKGLARSVNGILTLTDSKPDRRVSAVFLTSQKTGSATIYLMAAPGVWQLFRLNDTTSLGKSCACH